MKKWKGLLLLLIVTGVFLYFREDVRFRVVDTVSRWFREGVEWTELKPEDIKVVQKQLSQLMAEENCRYDQSLMLVNEEYRLTDAYTAAVSEYKDSGVFMNDCIMDAYAALAAAVQARFDEKLYVMSSYRTAEEQEALLASEGSDTAAQTGASEHQTGLALDVYVQYYAGDGFLKSEAGQFVNANCQDYGFIIRYPRGRESVTGIRYEPWHIRYVGEPHAVVIASNGLTLEEYIDRLKPDVFFQVGNYLISRQRGGEFYVPAVYEELTISPDNTGYYILTAKLS